MGDGRGKSGEFMMNVKYKSIRRGVPAAVALLFIAQAVADINNCRGVFENRPCDWGALRPPAYVERGPYYFIQILKDSNRAPTEHAAALAALKETPNKEALRVYLREAVGEITYRWQAGAWEVIGEYLYENDMGFVEKYLPLTRHTWIRKFISDYMKRLGHDARAGKPGAVERVRRLISMARDIDAREDDRPAYKLLNNNLARLSSPPYSARFHSNPLCGPRSSQKSLLDRSYEMLGEHMALSEPDFFKELCAEAGPMMGCYAAESMPVLLNEKGSGIPPDELSSVKAYLRSTAVALATAENSKMPQGT